MRTHHQVLDINKDGVVSWDDFETLIKKFKELGHLSPEEVANFTDALRVSGCHPHPHPHIQSFVTGQK